MESLGNMATMSSAENADQEDEEDTKAVTDLHKNILNIPLEVIRQIFLMVSQIDLKNLRLTCTYFREAANHLYFTSMDLMSYNPQKFEQHTKVLASVLPCIKRLSLDCHYPANVSGATINYEVSLLMKKFTGLRKFHLKNCIVEHGVSIACLPENVSYFYVDDVTFIDADYFFAMESCAKFSHVMFKLTLNHIEVSRALKGISVFANLQCLHLTNIDDLVDENFATLDGCLTNLTELKLINLSIGDRSFRTIGTSFRKLKTVYVNKCHNVSADGLIAAIGANVHVEEFALACCDRITDDNMCTVLDCLTNLKRLRIHGCVVQGRVFSSICRGLPNLEDLLIEKASFSPVINLGNVDVIVHEHLDVMRLSNSLLSESSIALLVSAMPKLSKLRLLNDSGIAAGLITDMGFKLIAEGLPRLEELTLRETLITEGGFARHAPRMTAMKNLSVNIKKLSGSGLFLIADYLSTVQHLQIHTDDDDRCSLTVQPKSKSITEIVADNLSIMQHLPMYSDDNRFSLMFKPMFKPVDNKNTIYARGLPGFITKLLPAFSDVMELGLYFMNLSASDVDCIADSHPNLELLNVCDSYCGDDVAIAILSKLRCLREVNISAGSCVTDTTLLQLEHLHEDCRLESLEINFKYFPSAATIARVAPILTALLNGFRISVGNGSDDSFDDEADYYFEDEQQDSISVTKEGKDDSSQVLFVRGRPIDDAMLLALVSHLASLETLRICKTSVSLSGFRAALLLPVFFSADIKLKVYNNGDFTRDEAVATIKELVMCGHLKSLSIHGKMFKHVGPSKAAHDETGSGAGEPNVRDHAPPLADDGHAARRHVISISLE